MTQPDCTARQVGREDPSSLTVQMIMREMLNLREVMEARMDGSDKIVVLLQASLVSRPDAITKEIDHLKNLHSERFCGVDKQFTERDVRTEQAAGAVKIAVDAALQAQKEAVGEQNKSSALAIAKSEASTNKQLDQIGINIASTNANLNDKIDDVKSQQVILNGQLLLMNGKIAGGRDNKDDHRANISIAVAVLAVVMSIAAIVYESKAPVAAAGNSVSTPQIIYVPTPQTGPTPITK